MPGDTRHERWLWKIRAGILVAAGLVVVWRYLLHS